ncbi:MAG: hypothetical protein IPM79_39790 [Polyangiaceae bacterium]|nr:hypothetical protein [Polyangiaceae bacterium]
MSDAQARKLMEEMSKHGRIGDAAMKAGMDRKTARRYVQAGKLPSEMVAPWAWRTREDPFAEDWAEVVALLEATPELEAKTIFEVLEERHPGRYEAGQLRTLQRHVRQWRAEHGPDREVVLAQQHRPGEASQVDFTWATSLGVTIMGALFVHMLCVFTLPFSNWQWASVCLSESLSALRRGVQAALFQLGRVPAFNQTDNSTAATHRIPDGKSVEADGGKRPFNEEYLALMRHFGMTAGRQPSAQRSRMEMSRRATGPSSVDSSKRCSFEAIATSRASALGRNSCSSRCARPTSAADAVSPMSSRRCGLSSSRGWRSSPRRT